MAATVFGAQPAAAQTVSADPDSSAEQLVERAVQDRRAVPDTAWYRTSRLRLEPSRHLLLRMRGVIVAEDRPGSEPARWRSPMLGERMASRIMGVADDAPSEAMEGAFGDLLATVRDGTQAPLGRLPVTDGSVPDPLSVEGVPDYFFSLGPRRVVSGETLQAVEIATREKVESGDVEGTIWFDREGRPVWTVLRGRGGALADRTFTTPVPFARTFAPADLRDATIALRYDRDGDVWRLGQVRAEAPLRFTRQVQWVESRWRLRSEPVPAALLDHLHARYDPRLRPTLSGLAVRALTNLRYNLVEGLSTAVAPALDIGPWVRVSGSLRKGTTSYAPSWNVSLASPYHPLRMGIEAYRRLEDANPWGRGLGRSNSVRALLLGNDEGQYFTTRGVTGWIERVHEWWALRVEGFAEEDQAAPPFTGFSIFSDTAGVNQNWLQAEPGTLYGIRVSVERQMGLDTRSGLAVLRGYGGAVGGDYDFIELGGSVDATRRLAGPVLAGVRVAAASTFGGPPVQRQYFVGGTHLVRGFEPGTAQGEAFWIARAEVAAGSPLIRGVVFGDAGWADRRSQLFRVDPLVSVGAGLSLLDGWFRIDFSRPIQGGSGIHFHFYTHGLL